MVHRTSTYLTKLQNLGTFLHTPLWNQNVSFYLGNNDQKEAKIKFISANTQEMYKKCCVIAPCFKKKKKNWETSTGTVLIS